MSKLLINESPLTVLPSLVKMIGLSEAIVLQQIHYWLNNGKAGEFINGHKWVYNSYQKWQEDNFSFWSVDGVKKIFLRLEEMGLLVSAQLSDNPWDKTKYYRIDYEKLDSLMSPSGSENPLDGVPSTPSTTKQRLPDTGNDKSVPVAPNELPLEWQIAAGNKVISLPDNKDAQYKDSANLIAQGSGSLESQIFNVAYAFMTTRGIIIPFEDAKGNRSVAKVLVKAGVQPHDIVDAVRYMLEKKLTCTDLYSVKKIALSLANPAPGQDKSQPQTHSKFEGV